MEHIMRAVLYTAAQAFLFHIALPLWLALIRIRGDTR